jgi:hypothetical protein
MDWKKRGIQLKSLRADDPGHLTLCKDSLSMSADEGDESRADLFEPPPGWQAESDEDWGPERSEADRAPEDLPPEALSRAIREELEEALGLLDEAMQAAEIIPLRE